MNKHITFFSLALAALMTTGAALAQNAPQDIRMALMECSAQGAGDNAKIEACMTARGFRKQAEVKQGPGTPVRPQGSTQPTPK